MKHLRDVLRREAGKVWREKAQVEGLRLFMGEETLTENVLFRLAVQARHQGIAVRPFTKAEEARNGADWEFWFISGPNAVGLRVQAKRIFRGGCYDSLNPVGTQIQKLVSSSQGLFPAFLFYNDPISFRHAGPICDCPEYRGNSYLGCTLASAHSVTTARTSDSGVLCRHMIPLHCLICGRSGGGKRRSLPDTVMSNLNERCWGGEGPTCNTVGTPETFAAFVERTGKIADYGAQFGEPGAPEDYFGLEGYLDSRELAGLALFGGAEEEE